MSTENESTTAEPAANGTTDATAPTDAAAATDTVEPGAGAVGAVDEGADEEFEEFHLDDLEVIESKVFG
ncbi:hypothetical protein [Streptomyces sp. NPDC058653]|uniref:hypothetical protein n=1 Tax=Streptomyces sp. NPDC058653 TaxID=3346576 RepID=UPI003645F7D9